MTSVAVVGAGAVGCYYGALLARAGVPVRFLMRRDLDAVRAHGLRIESKLGGFTLDEVDAVERPEEVGTPDWLICSLKTTSLDDAKELLAPAVGPRTRIVALMNGLGVEERIAEWFGAERLFGGMAFVCINRGEPGVVHHLDYGRVSIGHLLDDAAALAELAGLLRGAGIETVVAPNLRYARWEKLCWNVPFNGLSVAAGGIGTRLIMGDALLRQLAGRAMREVIAVGNADLASRGSDARLDQEAVVDAMFRQTGTMGDYRTSMALDFVAGRPLEVEAILGEVSRRAADLRVPVPNVDALYALVRIADLRRRGLVPVIPAAGV